jgi:hypothetical protein
MSKQTGTTVVVPGSHVVYVSQPQSVAAIIMQAAESVALAA